MGQVVYYHEKERKPTLKKIQGSQPDSLAIKVVNRVHVGVVSFQYIYSRHGHFAIRFNIKEIHLDSMSKLKSI